MPQFGLTPQGLFIKKLQDVMDETTANLRAVFGNGLNLLPTSVAGQFQGVYAEREHLIWEAIKAVYESFFPDTATGVALDNVVAITGIKRLQAVKAIGTGIAYGDLGFTIPAGSIISVNGNPTARFLTTQDNIIGPGTDEVQKIQFSSVPTAGTWTLIFDGSETGTFLFNDNAATIQTSLNNLLNLDNVTVSGNYGSGFTVTFTGSDGQKPQSLLKVGVNTLTVLGIAINVNFIEITPGVFPNVECIVIAESKGAIPAYAGTLTVIETPMAGWNSFTNPTDILNGKDIETDAELRLRRKKTLSTAGAGTVDSIRARLLGIDEVTEARVFENDQDVTDIYGRPPHSIEAIVQEGAEQEIADVIWEVKAAGIQTYGSIQKTVIDSMGFSHFVNFSRPEEIDIWIIVNVVTDPENFPIDGDEAIKENLVQYALDNIGIGDDVITVQLYCPITDVGGIVGLTILIGTSDPPVSSNNISIADDQRAMFDTSRITVNVT